MVHEVRLLSIQDIVVQVVGNYLQLLLVLHFFREHAAKTRGVVGRIVLVNLDGRAEYRMLKDDLVRRVVDFYNTVNNVVAGCKKI